MITVDLKNMFLFTPTMRLPLTPRTFAEQVAAISFADADDTERTINRLTVKEGRTLSDALRTITHACFGTDEVEFVKDPALHFECARCRVTKHKRDMGRYEDVCDICEAQSDEF